MEQRHRKGSQDQGLLSFIGTAFLMGIGERIKPSKKDLGDYSLYSPKEDM